MPNATIEEATLDTAALRAFGARHGNQGLDETSKIIGQAADEIDRLRRELDYSGKAWKAAMEEREWWENRAKLLRKYMPPGTLVG